jgi:hypothetical protein
MRIDSDLTQEIKDSIVGIGALINEHNYKAALEKCEKLFSEKAFELGKADKSTVGNLYLTMASCYTYLLNFDKAFEFIDIFEAKFSKNSEYYATKAITLFNHNDVDKAVSLLREIFPTDTYKNSKSLQLLAAMTFGERNLKLFNLTALDYLNSIFTEDEIDKLDKSTKMLYEQVLSILYLTNENYTAVIQLYRDTTEQSLMIKVNYIRALFEIELGQNVKLKYIMILSSASDIDYTALKRVYNEIIRVKTEEVNKGDYKNWDHCLGGIIYYCEWYLGKYKTDENIDEILSWQPEDIKDKLMESGFLSEEDIRVLEIGYNSVKSYNAEETIDIFWTSKKTSDKLLIEVENWLLPAAYHKYEEDVTNGELLDGILDFYEENGNSLSCRMMRIMRNYTSENKVFSSQQLLDLSNSCQSPFIIRNIVAFLLKMNDQPQALNIVRNTFNSKRYMFDIVPELWRFYYRLLEQQKQYTELCSFIGWLPENAPSDSEYLDIVIYISCLKGDLASAKKAAKKLMVIKPQLKPDLLMRIAIWDLYSYDLVDFSETIAELIRIETREKEKIQIEILQSQVGLLKGDNDFAFEHAKAAQKLAKYLPASPAHPNLFSVCIKTGHDFGQSGAMEYLHEYPTRNEWIKPIHMDLEKGTLPKELRDILETASHEDKENIKAYKAGAGVSIFMTTRKWSYQQVKRSLGWWRIANGSIELFRKEIDNSSKFIVVDHLTMYLLSSIDALEILNAAEKVLVSYSTVIALVEAFLQESSCDTFIINALNFIKHSDKVNIVACDNPFVDESISHAYIENCQKDKMLLSLFDSTLIAKDTSYTYVYGDINAQLLTLAYSVNSISVYGFIKKLHIDNKIPEDQYGELLEKAIEDKWDYLNTDSTDMYILFKKHNCCADDFTRTLFKILIQTEISSGVAALIGTVRLVIKSHGVYSCESDTIISLVINGLARRHLRTTYNYYSALDKRNSTQSNVFEKYYSTIRSYCRSGIAACLAFYDESERHQALKDSTLDLLSKYLVFTNEELADIFSSSRSFNQLSSEYITE